MADRRHWTLILLFFSSRKHSSQTREHEAEERSVDKFPDNIVSVQSLKWSYLPLISLVGFLSHNLFVIEFPQDLNPHLTLQPLEK